mgnify:FL=1
MSKIKSKSLPFYEFDKIIIYVVIFLKSSELVNSFWQLVVMARRTLHFKSSTILHMIVFLKNLSKAELIHDIVKKFKYRSELMDKIS